MSLPTYCVEISPEVGAILLVNLALSVLRGVKILLSCSAIMAVSVSQSDWPLLTDVCVCRGRGRQRPYQTGGEGLGPQQFDHRETD